MDELTINISDTFESECRKMVNKICHLKHLDEKQILELILPNKLYFNELANNLVSKKKKKTNRRILPKHERCLGRKNDLTQCTRKRKDGHEFCGSHIKNLPNGKVGDNGDCFKIIKAKRGRKPKNVYNSENKSGILGTKKYIHENLYLVDSKNVVYAYRENLPVILGVLNGDLLDSTKFMNVKIDDPLVKKSLVH